MNVFLTKLMSMGISWKIEEAIRFPRPGKFVFGYVDVPAYSRDLLRVSKDSDYALLKGLFDTLAFAYRRPTQSPVSASFNIAS